MQNLLKIRKEKLFITYNYPEILIYQKIEKKKLIKKIPEIINLIDEIGLDYDWYIKLQKYKDRLTFNINENNLTFNTYNYEQFFEVIFSIKRLANIIYFVVNLNEICNRDFESKKFINRLSIGKNVPNNDKKELKIWDKTSIEFNKTTNKIIDDKKRKSVLSAGVFQIKSTLNKNNEDNKKNIYGTVIHHKMINLNDEKKNDKRNKNDIQNKKLKKNSKYDNIIFPKYFH